MQYVRHKKQIPFIFGEFNNLKVFIKLQWIFLQIYTNKNAWMASAILKSGCLAEKREWYNSTSIRFLLCIQDFRETTHIEMMCLPKIPHKHQQLDAGMIPNFKAVS